MRRRTILLVAVAAFALVLALPGVAVAYETVHGGSAMDTDACAGCHRAHTAASPITWVDTNQNEQSALLISTATTIDEFCYTCHGTAALGADTNVWDGVFESDDGDFGSDETYNTHGQPLNGGGFDTLSGEFYTGHYGGSEISWVAFGGGDDGRDAGSIVSVGGEEVAISCASCHDTHGSSNYRLLKDIVAGSLPTGGVGERVVGGYIGTTPDPWVISAEVGYPVGGWALGQERMAQYTFYFPDFTDPMYAKAPGGDVNKGISGWCASCHTQYNTWGPDGLDAVETSLTAEYASHLYDAADGFGLVERHRHPVNVPLSNFAGPRPLLMGADLVLPVAHDSNADAAVKSESDWVDCLSCHMAHGSKAEMTGYAAIADVTNIEPGSDELPPGSVPPDISNAILRLDNRGVCQACHNK